MNVVTLQYDGQNQGTANETAEEQEKQHAPGVKPVSSQDINPLNTKRRLLHLKTHFVPRSKHFSSQL